MGALEATFVYNIESKNVKKVLVFKGILKNSCKELFHFEKKIFFLIKKDFFTKYKSFGSSFGRMIHY